MFTLSLYDPPEATWTEWCTLYRDFLKKFTFSTVDKEEKTICYAIVKAHSSRGVNNDFEPITFLTQFYFQTQKGTSASLCDRDSQHIFLNMNIFLIHFILGWIAAVII